MKSKTKKNMIKHLENCYVVFSNMKDLELR
jgi:hypothetical protein